MYIYIAIYYSSTYVHVHSYTLNYQLFTSYYTVLLTGAKKTFFTTSHDLFLSSHYMDYDHHNTTGSLAFLMMATSRHERWKSLIIIIYPCRSV